MLAIGGVLALAVAVFALVPTFLAPQEAPGVDAPGCGWGVVADIHPDIAGESELVRRCDEITAEKRRATGVLAIAPILLLVGGAAIRPRRQRDDIGQVAQRPQLIDET